MQSQKIDQKSVFVTFLHGDSCWDKDGASWHQHILPSSGDKALQNIRAQRSE